MANNPLAEFLPSATEMSHKLAAAIFGFDLSLSMEDVTPQGVRKIDTLFDAASTLKPLGMSDDRLRTSGDVLVLGFPGSNGQAAEVIADWGPFEALPPLMPPQTLRAGSPLASAVEVALDQLDQRSQYYRDVKVKCDCPHIFFITDGFGTEGREPQRVAGRKVQDRVRAKKLKFELLFVEHSDLEFQRQVLRELEEDFGQAPRVVDPAEFGKLFAWFTMTMGQGPGGGGEYPAREKAHALPFD